jgi:predicted ATPase
METTKEGWFEAELNRVAGEIAFRGPGPDIAKAESYFERALAIARQQQAKSWVRPEIASLQAIRCLLAEHGRHGRSFVWPAS